MYFVLSKPRTYRALSCCFWSSFSAVFQDEACFRCRQWDNTQLCIPNQEPNGNYFHSFFLDIIWHGQLFECS